MSLSTDEFKLIPKLQKYLRSFINASILTLKTFPEKTKISKTYISVFTTLITLNHFVHHFNQVSNDNELPFFKRIKQRLSNRLIEFTLTDRN